MKQLYIFKQPFLCLILTFFIISNLQAEALTSAYFFNDGGTVTESQIVNLNETPDPIVETVAPALGGPVEYLWMISIPSDPVLNQWNPVTTVIVTDSTSSTLTFTGPLSVTSLFTRCVRLAGTTDNYVETNVVSITVLNVLPIELSSFDAVDNNDGTVQLKWVTASERNNEYFELESSSDGLEFSVLEKIRGALNSDEVNFYSYQHLVPNFGDDYYRLKQVDTNGDFEYSDIISLKMTKGFAKIFSIFPNPVSHELNIKINSPLSGDSSLEVINTMGQVVFQLNSIPTPNTRINLDRLSSGTYFIKIFDNQNILFQDKIVKLQ